MNIDWHVILNFQQRYRPNVIPSPKDFRDLSRSLQAPGIIGREMVTIFSGYLYEVWRLFWGLIT